MTLPRVPARPAFTIIAFLAGPVVPDKAGDRVTHRRGELVSENRGARLGAAHRCVRPRSGVDVVGIGALPVTRFAIGAADLEQFLVLADRVGEGSQRAVLDVLGSVPAGDLAPGDPGCDVGGLGPVRGAELAGHLPGVQPGAELGANPPGNLKRHPVGAPGGLGVVQLVSATADACRAGHGWSSPSPMLRLSSARYRSAARSRASRCSAASTRYRSCPPVLSHSSPAERTSRAAFCGG